MEVRGGLPSRRLIIGCIFLVYRLISQERGGGGGGGGGSVLVRGRLISSTLCYITGGGDIGIFYWWGRGQTLVQKGLLNFFVAIKLLLTETTTCFSIWNANRQSPGI